MYNVNTQQIVLEIPKNGSRSLVQAACDHQGKKWMKSQGHHTLKGFLTGQMEKLIQPSQRPSNPVQVIAVYRNPVERLLSQLRQAERKKANVTLDELMQIAWQQSDIVFAPQWKFTTVPESGSWEYDWRIWPMERIHQACNFLAGKEVNYHKNKNRGYSKIDKDTMMNHELYDELMESEKHYAPDFKLWIGSMRNKKDGTRD